MDCDALVHSLFLTSLENLMWPEKKVRVVAYEPMLVA
jgi:hypothetical protein